MAVAEQQFESVREQLPEGNAQAEADVRTGIDFSIRAQYASLEATIEEYTSQYEEVYISPPEEDEDVLEVLNEMDYIAGPKYIKWYDGVVTTVRKAHPKVKFIGNCHAGLRETYLI